LSMPVLAHYAGRGTDAQMSNILRKGTGALERGLPASVPSSLVTEFTNPAFVRLALIAGQQPESSPVANTAVAEQAEQPLEERHEAERFDRSAEQPEKLPEANGGLGLEEGRGAGIDNVQPVSTSSAVDLVMLLPWRGPFGWNGLIVASASPGITLDVLEPYREPLSRLTDRVAFALELEHEDAVIVSADQRASLTTDFSRSMIACLEGPSPLDAIVREVTRVERSDSAALWRIDDASGMIRMIASYGLTSTEFLPLPVGQGLAGSVAQSGEVLSVEDAPADPRCIFPREARESGVVSYLGAPLAAEGKVFGVIEVHCASRRSWTEGDERLLESAATIISELVKSTDSRGNRLPVDSAYLGLSESLQRLRSADEVKEAVVEILGHALGASRVIVVELNERGQPEPVKHEYRRSSVKSALGVTFAETLAAGVTASNEEARSIAIADSHQHSLAGPQTADDLGVLSELATPINLDGETREIIYVHQCDRARDWDHDEIEFTERVVRQVSVSLWSLRSLEMAANEARQARADTRRAREISNEAPARIQKLEKKLEDVQRLLAQSRSLEEEARVKLENTSAVEAKARNEAEVSRRAESDIKQQLERLQEEHKQVQVSAQQLLEINRLKSEVIVNAGHEMEASLQSVLGLAELLERGSYGNLTAEQREAVHGIYGSARRIKSDVDWLVEYGSTRSRRLESTGGSQ
ncbi:MAG TPA: GAF domain-containing protein, partial [Blastocatellia bacterium]|nr:GAF domain-containing protein [Blastocatellia bacterium]